MNIIILVYYIYLKCISLTEENECREVNPSHGLENGMSCKTNSYYFGFLQLQSAIDKNILNVSLYFFTYFIYVYIPLFHHREYLLQKLLMLTVALFYKAFPETKEIPLILLSVV